jgi:S1-C subfamily serine protease
MYFFRRKGAHRALAIAALSCALLTGAGALLPGQNTAQPSEPQHAICPVIYPVDQSPGERGYQYVFYGNAFFINEDGYLITAAHVLSDLHDGGKPSILVPRKDAPPRILGIKVIATDRVHDIAILQAVPNPFTGRNFVSLLRLSAKAPEKGEFVVAAALRPSHLRSPHSFEIPEQERDPGEVVNFLEEALDKGVPPTNIFLFSHEVLRGQSGAPVLDGAGNVVGIVEGRWLHPTATTSGTLAQGQTPPLGAAIPIPYVLELLRESNIQWHTGEGAQDSATDPPPH